MSASSQPDTASAIAFSARDLLRGLLRWLTYRPERRYMRGRHKREDGLTA